MLADKDEFTRIDFTYGRFVIIAVKMLNLKVASRQQMLRLKPEKIAHVKSVNLPLGCTVGMCNIIN